MERSRFAFLSPHVLSLVLQSMVAFAILRFIGRSRECNCAVIWGKRAALRPSFPVVFFILYDGQLISFLLCI